MTGFELAILLALLGGTAATVGGQMYANKKNQQLNSQRFLDSTELANTAHQREVYDLRMAGLNPILSTGTAGAAVPNVASAEVSNPLASLDNVGKGIGNFMNNSAVTRSQVDLNAMRSNSLKGEVAIQNELAEAAKNPEVQDALKDELILRGAPSNALEATYLEARRWRDEHKNNEEVEGIELDNHTEKDAERWQHEQDVKRAEEREKKEKEERAAADDKKARAKQKTSKSYRHRMRGY